MSKNEGVEVKVKSSDAVLKALAKLKKTEVLVGIPEGSTREDTPLTNAELGFIHENGSPASGIPARPFLVPGVTHGFPEIRKNLEAAVKAAYRGKVGMSMKLLDQAGTAGASAVEKEISTADFAPLKPSTIANRNKSRGTVGKRENEKAGSEGFGQGIRPLINIGRLRDSITHIVKGGK